MQITHMLHESTNSCEFSLEDKNKSNNPGKKEPLKKKHIFTGDAYLLTGLFWLFLLTSLEISACWVDFLIATSCQKHKLWQDRPCLVIKWVVQILSRTQHCRWFIWFSGQMFVLQMKADSCAVAVLLGNVIICCWSDYCPLASAVTAVVVVVVDFFPNSTQALIVSVYMMNSTKVSVFVWLVHSCCNYFAWTRAPAMCRLGIIETAIRGHYITSNNICLV